MAYMHGLFIESGIGRPRKDCSIRLKLCVLILHLHASLVFGIKCVSPIFQYLRI